MNMLDSQCGGAFFTLSLSHLGFGHAISLLAFDWVEIHVGVYDMHTFNEAQTKEHYTCSIPCGDIVYMED